MRGFFEMCRIYIYIFFFFLIFVSIYTGLSIDLYTRYRICFRYFSFLSIVILYSGNIFGMKVDWNLYIDP